MRHAVLSVFIALAVASAGTPLETPADEGYQGRYTPPTPLEIRHNPGPVWHRLATMNPTERANAAISLERAEPLARDIEHLWNTGQYDRALALFPELNPQELGINWRTPIAAGETDWNTPVEVSARDSVVKVEIAADSVTGNLFCAILYLGDGNMNSWALNLSTDGGESWSETATWGASIRLPDIALKVVSGHAYVGYIRGNVNQANVRRHRVSDGTHEGFPSGGAFFTLGEVAFPDTIREVALASNHIEFDNRLFGFFNTRSGKSLLTTYSTPGFGDTWVTTTGMPNDVSHGIDYAWNHSTAENVRVFSYINAGGNVRVYGTLREDGVEELFGGMMASNGSYTALAPWKDTLHVVFDQERSATTQVRYLVRYEPSASWLQGGLGDTTAGFSRNAAATGGWGDGVAVTFWQYPQNGPGQCFRWRDYSGEWSPAVGIQQGLTTASDRVPAIARVAPGVHGVVFTRGTRYGMAYFNRSDWTSGGIAELEPVLPQDRLGTTIARGAYRLPGTMPGVLLDISGRRVKRLLPGHNDLSSVAPGVYFIAPDTLNPGPVGKLVLAE